MIVIKKNPNGDTRTATKVVTFEEFQEANKMHREDVRAVMWKLADMIGWVGENHDCTKKSQERMFYRDFLSTIINGTRFVNSEWYQLHVKAERHHLLSNCPEDVNLIDVLEMIADCVCAGIARSGKVRSLEISDDILRSAVNNTVDLIESMIVAEDENDAKSPDDVRGVGEWIKIDRVADMEAFKCSACGSYVHVSTVYEKPMYEYCPMCGARMKGAEDVR